MTRSYSTHIVEYISPSKMLRFLVIFVRNNPGDSRAPSCFFLVKNPLTAKKQVACLSSQFIMTLRPPIHSASLQHH